MPDTMTRSFSKHRPDRMRRAAPIVIALVLAGCDGDIAEVAQGPSADEGILDHVAAGVTVEIGDDYTRGLGEKAGAFFEVIRPHAWNGELVLLMHGAVAPADPIALRSPLHWQTQPTIDALVARGYGVALSSYRKNGFAVQEGATDTRIAEAAFTSQFGLPDVTWLLGWSMGGAVGHQLIGSGAGRYAGFLSLCSDQVGAARVHQYWLDARVLFDYYFPGVLPWDIRTDQANLLLEVLPAIQGAFVADPPAYVEKVLKLSSMDQLQLPLGDGSPIALILTVLGSLFGFGGGNADLIETLGGLPVGNVDRVYTSDLLSPAELADLNTSVARHRADPEAERRMLRFSPSGKLHGTPVLALHTDGDAIVPKFVPEEFVEVVENAGDEDLFALRIVPAFGHCELTPDAAPDGFIDIQMQAFDDLVAWVKEGVRPPS